MDARRPLCVRVGQRDSVMADRLWGTLDDADGGSVCDRLMRRRGRAICDVCPVRVECLAAALTGRRKDDSHIIGGLTYRERRLLAGHVGEALSVSPRRLHRVHPTRIASWLREHPWIVGEVRDEQRAYWRTTKLLSDERVRSES